MVAEFIIVICGDNGSFRREIYYVSVSVISVKRRSAGHGTADKIYAVYVSCVFSTARTCFVYYSISVIYKQLCFSVCLSVYIPAFAVICIFDLGIALRYSYESVIAVIFICRRVVGSTVSSEYRNFFFSCRSRTGKS